ncbi:purine and uridine phosphorylase [Aulographum hederae CBS 113979]|uniref:Purine and uridine phosphorylase n=1 Tax=Aulographum hederae CBS 113979 TaxID=1176131 RepID=A0A6G1H9B8_9PEZI|nr:purine and uridine phosphorylase [Aulographum hederae CBS 113979]
MVEPTQARRPSNRNEFEIAIICALSEEADAVKALFDVDWDLDRPFGRATGDTNIYSTGRIGIHNVVLVHLAGMGKINAASGSARILCSYENVRLGLVVGICGGVPTIKAKKEVEKEVFLGDIVISTGVVQYDLVRKFPNKAVTKDTLEDALSRPNLEIRAFLQKIKGSTDQDRLKNTCRTQLTKLLGKQSFQKCRYPGDDKDILFPPAYRHKHQQPGGCDTCSRCNNDDDDTCDDARDSTCEVLGCVAGLSNELTRRRDTNLGQPPPEPQIYFGRIGSGDWVIKSGRDRDIIAKEHQLLAFEMEGGGVWDNVPTVVIKAVCDYADSHKNKAWQNYAAAVAASCTGAFLQQWPGPNKSLPARPSPGKSLPFP